MGREGGRRVFINHQEDLTLAAVDGDHNRHLLYSLSPGNSTMGPIAVFRCLLCFPPLALGAFLFQAWEVHTQCITLWQLNMPLHVPLDFLLNFFTKVGDLSVDAECSVCFYHSRGACSLTLRQAQHVPSLTPKSRPIFVSTFQVLLCRCVPQCPASLSIRCLLFSSSSGA